MENPDNLIHMPFNVKFPLRFLVVSIFIVTTSNAYPQTKLPAIISSNMVLQQQVIVPLWGWDTPGQTVDLSASWLDSPVKARSNKDGEWRIDVPTPKAGGPYELTISGSKDIVLNNVMVGEVWLCSGQSNMEMPVKGWAGQPVTESEQVIATADYPEIRLFTVARKTSFEPLNDCEGNWTECSPEQMPDFSAAGYFFGLELYRKLGIPIGLIHSSWGGTPAEAWTSKEFISRIPYFQTYPGECDSQEFRQVKLDAYQIVQDKWLGNLGFLPGLEKAPDWVLPGFQDKYWEKIEVPAKWENTRLGNYSGMVEFRLSFKVPRKWSGKEIQLELGPIDEIDITWVNGVQVASHPNPYSWATPRIYKIPAGIVKPGNNTIAIQVGNTSGAGGIFGEANQLRIFPVGNDASFKILKGKWKARKSISYGEVVDMPYCDNCGEPNTPTTLYNGMISPLIPFRIKGAIWYQGESNRYDGQLYGQIFPNMINNWRNDWGQGDFSFYYVQIAPYTYRDELSTGLLREAQHHAMKLPNTGMVVTMDIGDLVTIHPPNKEDVGKRLAYWALAKDYQMEGIPFSGPLYKEYKKEVSKIRIIFDNVGEGLKMDGPELIHFLIAGRDRVFVPARAEIEGKTLIVYSPEVKNPMAVRFGWGSTDQTNLFNFEGLPAGPFRTDNWNDN